MFFAPEGSRHHVKVPGESIVEWPFALDRATRAREVVLESGGYVVGITLVEI
jgi:hypothetical protein